MVTSPYFHKVIKVLYKSGITRTLHSWDPITFNKQLARLKANDNPKVLKIEVVDWKDRQ